MGGAWPSASEAAKLSPLDHTMDVCQELLQTSSSAALVLNRRYAKQHQKGSR